MQLVHRVRLVLAAHKGLRALRVLPALALLAQLVRKVSLVHRAQRALLVQRAQVRLGQLVHKGLLVLAAALLVQLARRVQQVLLVPLVQREPQVLALLALLARKVPQGLKAQPEAEVRGLSDR